MSWLHELRSGPDLQTLSIRREGELLVARVRLWAATLWILIPAVVIVREPRMPEGWIGLLSAWAMIGVSAAISRLAARPEPPRLLGLFTCIVDVSIVSAGNAAFILTGSPLAATSGRVYFSLFLLVLALTCIRHDARLCLVAGITAMVQYIVIVFWALQTIDPMQRTSYGAFRWDNQITRLGILAVATAINIVIVRRGQRFMTAALQDLLTGLPNRRYAETRLQESVAIARRARRTLIVAMADLDDFKPINDRYGHEAGDEVLREAGRRLREFCRSTDMVARYGGDEFLIAMLDADSIGAMRRLRELQNAFASTPFALPRGDTAAVKLSIGIAICPDDGIEVADLIAVADARMYAAKRLQDPPLPIAYGDLRQIPHQT